MIIVLCALKPMSVLGVSDLKWALLVSLSLEYVKIINYSYNTEHHAQMIKIAVL
jgi:hypothetical protein